MQPIKTTWVVAIVACRDQVFRAMEDVAVGLLRSSPALTIFLSAVRSFSRRCATALSPRGLSLPSGGSLLAISPVGAGATVVCGSGVPTTSAAADLVLSFLLVKSLVRLFQNSIVV